MLGWVLAALGVYSFVWGVGHLNEPPMPNPHLLYDGSYSSSRQVESIFGGLVGVMFSYLAFRKGRT